MIHLDGRCPSEYHSFRAMSDDLRISESESWSRWQLLIQFDDMDVSSVGKNGILTCLRACQKILSMISSVSSGNLVLYNSIQHPFFEILSLDTLPEWLI